MATGAMLYAKKRGGSLEQQADAAEFGQSLGTLAGGVLTGRGANNARQNLKNYSGSGGQVLERGQNTESALVSSKDRDKNNAPPRIEPKPETKPKSIQITNEERQTTNKNRGLEPAKPVSPVQKGEGNRLGNPHLKEEEAMLAQIAREEQLRKTRKHKTPKKNETVQGVNPKTNPIVSPEIKPPKIQPPGPTIVRFTNGEADLLITFWGKSNKRKQLLYTTKGISKKNLCS